MHLDRSAVSVRKLEIEAGPDHGLELVLRHCRVKPKQDSAQSCVQDCIWKLKALLEIGFIVPRANTFPQACKFLHNQHFVFHRSHSTLILRKGLSRLQINKTDNENHLPHQMSGFRLYRTHPLYF
jgi:hypothetical protein